MKYENIIYGLIDPNTGFLRYIGKTGDIETRIEDHHKLSKLKETTHKNSWIKSLIKNGQKAEYIVLESYETYEELNQAEIDLIAYYRFIGCDLTNSTEGGTGGKMSKETIEKIAKSKRGQTHTEETKQKMSDAHMGHISYNLGMKHTEETKAKISAGNKGKIVSDETKQKISIAQIGKVVSEETRKKQSIAQTGKISSPEKKSKISQSLLGNKHSLGRILSEETKNKMSNAHVGKIVSDETKNKLSNLWTDEKREEMSTKFKSKTWIVIDGKRVWIDK